MHAQHTHASLDLYLRDSIAARIAARRPFLSSPRLLPHRPVYDVLLDDYEKGMTAARLDEIFGQVKAGLVPLLAELRERGTPPSGELQGKQLIFAVHKCCKAATYAAYPALAPHTHATCPRTYAVLPPCLPASPLPHSIRTHIDLCLFPAPIPSQMPG